MSDIRKVSVAVPSWNGLEHLKICLAALREQVDPGDQELFSSPGFQKWKDLPLVRSSLSEIVQLDRERQTTPGSR